MPRDELAQEYPFVYAAVGWHPEEWQSWNGESMALLRSLCAQPKVVAIGEIGLDYYWDTEHKALQKEMFEWQLSLAIERNLPVIVHDREAHGDSLEIVMNYPEARGVFHCFSGSAEMAKELVRRGWYLGFDGPVTYKNNKKAAVCSASMHKTLCAGTAPQKCAKLPPGITPGGSFFFILCICAGRLPSAALR